MERFGRFQLYDRLGAGVSHDSWKAWEDAAGRWVALRVWSRPGKSEREAAQRALGWAGVPGFVAPVGGGTDGGRLWLAREWIEGGALTDLAWTEERKFVRVARDAARILAAAHALGRAHGKVTAGNVLVGADGGVWLADAGLVVGAPGGDATGLSRTFAELFGLPGDPREPGTVRGALAGHASTTRLGDHGPLITADPRLAEILLRGREGRLDAAGLAVALDGWLGGGVAGSMPRRPRVIAGAAAGILALAAVLGGLGLRSRSRARAIELVAQASELEGEGRHDEAGVLFAQAVRSDGRNVAAREGHQRVLAGIARAAEDRKAAEALADAHRAALAKVGAGNEAIAAAELVARESGVTRARLDDALAPVFACLREAFDISPGLPEAVDLAWRAADLSDHGAGSAAAFAGLPSGLRGVSPPPIPAWREAFRMWVMLVRGVRGSGLPLRESSDALRALGLSRGARPALDLPDDAAHYSRPLAAALAALEASLSPGAPEHAYVAAARALLEGDVARAEQCSRAATGQGAGELTADAWLLRALLERSDPRAHAERGLRLRPWDLALMEVQSRVVARSDPPDFQSAIQAAEAVLALHPESIDLRLNRSWWKLHLRDAAAAIADLEPLIAREPHALAQRALIRLLQGDARTAIADALEALRRQPLQLIARDVLISARLQIGQEDGLSADCDTLIALQPNRPASYAVRAAVRRGAGDVAAAASDCDRALELNPLEVQALLVRSKIRSWTGDSIGAMADVEIACRLRPEAAEPMATRAYIHALSNQTEEADRDVRAAMRSDPEEPMVLVASAWVALARNDPHAALSAANRAVHLRPALPDARFTRLRALCSLRRIEEALAEADWVLDRSRYVDVAYLRVQMLLGLGRLREAGEEAGRMVREWPGAAQARFARALARRALGEEGWLEDLEAALAADPRMELALEARTLGLLEAGRMEDALKSADAGIVAEPTSGLLRVARARVRIQLRNFDAALQDLTEALRVAPQLELDVRRRRAGILLETGSADQAADELIAALRVDARDVECWRLLGDARRALGNPRGAAEAWRKVLELADLSDPQRALAEKGIRDLGDGGK